MNQRPTAPGPERLNGHVDKALQAVHSERIPILIGVCGILFTSYNLVAFTLLVIAFANGYRHANTPAKQS